MTAKRKLIFLAQLGALGRYDPAVFANQPGGDNEIEWFQLMLDGLGLLETLDYEGRRICYGDTLPATDEADAFVIGGSFHSVHDGLDWQEDLYNWVRDLWTMETPPSVFGICGGHQMISHMLGAPVEYLDDGPLASTLPVNLTEAGHSHWLFESTVPRFHFGNEEHVADAPPNATVLANGNGMPACALDYGKGWISVQFHPECTDSCIRDSWGPRASEVNYVPTPASPQLFANFLKANGVL